MKLGLGRQVVHYSGRDIVQGAPTDCVVLQIARMELGNIVQPASQRHSGGKSTQNLMRKSHEGYDARSSTDFSLKHGIVKCNKLANSRI